MFTIENYIEAKRVGGRYLGKSASANTLRTYTTALKKAESLLGKPISQITSEDSDTLLILLDKEGASAQSKTVLFSALRGAFTWAIGKGLYDSAHPVDGITVTTTKRKLPTVLTKSDLDKFFAYFKNKPKYHLFFKLMYFGGLRIHEVAQLRKENVKEEGVVVNGKGNKQRYVYLPESLRTELFCWMEDFPEGPFVFSGRNSDESMDLSYARILFGEARDALSFPKELHPHNLRHTSATHFYKATGDMALTQKMLGHESISTTLIYAQIADEQLHTAQKKAFGE